MRTATWRTPSMRTQLVPAGSRARSGLVSVPAGPSAGPAPGHKGRPSSPSAPATSTRPSLPTRKEVPVPSGPNDFTESTCFTTATPTTIPSPSRTGSLA